MKYFSHFVLVAFTDLILVKVDVLDAFGSHRGRPLDTSLVIIVDGCPPGCIEESHIFYMILI